MSVFDQALRAAAAECDQLKRDLERAHGSLAAFRAENSRLREALKTARVMMLADQLCEYGNSAALEQRQTAIACVRAALAGDAGAEDPPGWDDTPAAREMALEKDYNEHWRKALPAETERPPLVPDGYERCRMCGTTWTSGGRPCSEHPVIDNATPRAANCEHDFRNLLVRGPMRWRCEKCFLVTDRPSLATPPRGRR